MVVRGRGRGGQLSLRREIFTHLLLLLPLLHLVSLLPFLPIFLLLPLEISSKAPSLPVAVFLVFLMSLVLVLPMVSGGR